MGRVAWDGEMILKHLKVHYWTVWNFIWRRIFLERWKGDHSEISSRSRRGTNIWSQDRKHTRFVGSQLIQFRTLHVIRWPALIEEKKYHRLKLRKSWAPENLSIRFGGNTASQQPLPGNKTWEEDNRTSGTWRFNKYTSPFSWSSRSPLGLLGGGSNLTCTGVWATTDYFLIMCPFHPRLDHQLVQTSVRNLPFLSWRHNLWFLLSATSMFPTLKQPKYRFWDRIRLTWDESITYQPQGRQDPWSTLVQIHYGQTYSLPWSPGPIYRRCTEILWNIHLDKTHLSMPRSVITRLPFNPLVKNLGTLWRNNFEHKYLQCIPNLYTTLNKSTLHSCTAKNINITNLHLLFSLSAMTSASSTLLTREPVARLKNSKSDSPGLKVLALLSTSACFQDFWVTIGRYIAKEKGKTAGIPTLFRHSSPSLCLPCSRWLWQACPRRPPPIHRTDQGRLGQDAAETWQNVWILAGWVLANVTFPLGRSISLLTDLSQQNPHPWHKGTLQDDDQDI